MPSHCRAVGSFEIKRRPYRALSDQPVSFILIVNDYTEIFRFRSKTTITITVSINVILMVENFYY